MKFTHLHCHTHYSLLDGLSKIGPLVDAAKNLGMDSLAITDHGVMYGTIEFYNACLEAEIKPIIGMEAYIAPRTRHDKEGKGDADYFHMTLLAQNDTGYKNLIKLTTYGHTEGFYYKPRIDKELLTQYSEGIIALSGCQRGPVARAVMENIDSGRKALEEYIEIFGKDNFFLEIQRNAKITQDIDRETELNTRLIALAKEYGLDVVATGDSHYIHPEDNEAQDVLVCIGTGRTVQDENRLNMTSHELSLKSPEQMAELFKDIPEAVTNTQKIVERCELKIATNERYFAKVKVPEGMNNEEYLTHLVNEKAPALYNDKTGTIPEAVRERIDYELNIINSKGFAPYFIMVANITEGAHSIGAITNTRGSAAGSIVGRILGITNVDPLYYELPFERFLTMHRPTPPDIDLDIADNRRDQAIEWMTNEYGKDKVAQIITFGTMMARAAVRDVGRALGVAYGKCDRISKMIPIGKQGFNMTLTKALEMNPELKQVYDTDPETKRIIDVARKLEGGARHASIHAAGIVITPTPMIDYTPLQKEPDGDRMITQYDMHALDVNVDPNAIGVIKMDLLGIRNLTILEGAVTLVKQRHNIDIDLANLPHPDEKTFKLLSDGYTFGVFQLGSSGMTRYLRELKPSTIFDVMAMIALYRPGPLQFIPEYIARKHNPSLIKYLDPALERILSRSYGILVYQDDLLTIAHDLAGYSWEEVDKFRKAVGKKIPEQMAMQKIKFIEGCMKTSGWTQQKAEQVWTWIEPFAAYGFNKSHSASYAVVSYQTAYMKANYTVEFMAAVMTAESGNEDKIYAAVEECRNLGIRVLPPDVNESQGDFTVVDEHTIRFGLNAIKNLGSDVVIKIIECNQGGKQHFKTLEDFLLKCRTKNLNKKSWEALVKAGALDKFGERGQLLVNTEYVLDFLRDHFKSENSGQNSLFGASLQIGKLRLKDGAPATQDEMLLWEKEHLGFYVSAHPLDNYKAVLKSFLTIREVTELEGEQLVTIGGIISKLKRTLTKKNDPMAFFTIEDATGSVEVLVFPKVMPIALPYLEVDKVIQVTGRLSDKDGECKIIANELTSMPNDELYMMALAEMEKNKQVVIHMINPNNPGALNKIKDIILTYPGNAQVYLSVGQGTGAKKIKTQSQVRITADLMSALKEIPEVTMVSQN
jgi:DNA polymerase III subunit alpha